MFVLDARFSAFNFTTNYGHNPLTFSSLLPSNSILFRSSYSCKLFYESNSMSTDPTRYSFAVGCPMLHTKPNSRTFLKCLSQGPRPNWFTGHRPTRRPVPCMVWAHVPSVQQMSWSVLMNSSRCPITTHGTWQQLTDKCRPAGPTTNTARLSPRYEGKTRGCHCRHWAPDDGRETPETCWAVNKRQDNKLENCCIWLVIYFNYTENNFKVSEATNRAMVACTWTESNRETPIYLSEALLLEIFVRFSVRLI